MKNAVKENLFFIVIIILLYGLGFAAGYLFDRAGNTGYQGGAAADVSGYDSASQRVEKSAAAIRDASASVAEAAGEVRNSIDDVGIITSAVGDIRDGTDRALDRTSRVESRVQFIMGILDEAEKRNTEMEEVSDIWLD